MSHRLSEYDQIPIYSRDELIRYILFGINTGGFLAAVLEDKLMLAAHRADLSNSKLIWLYAKYLHNYAPSRSHGDYDRVEKWMAARMKNPLQARDLSWPSEAWARAAMEIQNTFAGGR